ncbi:unnamed protein product [Tilletia caries]|nr:unnamed protein product [Tilletia caries]
MNPVRRANPRRGSTASTMARSDLLEPSPSNGFDNSVPSASDSASSASKEDEEMDEDKEEEEDEADAYNVASDSDSLMSCSHGDDTANASSRTPMSAFLALANFKASSGSTHVLPVTSLSKHKSRAGKKWVRKTSVPTRQLYQWFEAQLNDFSSHDHHVSDDVRLGWVGHPGDSPRDVSARSFVVEYDPLLTRQAKRDAAKRGGVVYRHRFLCMGACNQPEPEEVDDDTEPEEAHVKARRSGTSVGLPRGLCNGSVKLLVEVSAKDLSTCIIYQQGNHQDAATRDLQDSRRLRLHLFEQGSKAGTTAARLKLELLMAGQDAADSGGLPRLFPRPKWRLPSAAKIDRIMAGLRQARRLHFDPFVAVDVFVRQNSFNVFAYRPLSTGGKTKIFSVGVKSEWSIQNLIRYHGSSVFLDSSWRNKNENRAPLIFVATSNNAGHMVPCAAYLSADATAASFEHLLRALEVEVVSEAELLCEQALEDETIDSRDMLFVNAAKIRDEGAWRPASVMIDKCRAELKALESVWPETQIRVCQFHIVQAICRWDTDNKANAARPPGIHRKDKAGICFAFRDAQRCNSMDEWPATQAAFETAIKSCLKAYKADIIEQVLNYFEVNWWSAPWLPLSTDIGLGAGQTRDGINTNNPIERAFKTFDEVFLACRVNKRIDRLLHVLVCDWLNYYEHYSSEVPRPSSNDKKTMMSAHKIWESQAIIPSRTSSTTYTVLGVTDS